MPTVTEAKQSIAQAKTAIQQRREQAIATEKQLQQAKAKLPNITSQQYLRQKMGGLKGRLQRQQIEKAGKEIELKREAIGKYKKELSQYEKDVLATEQKVKTYETESALASQRQAQLQTAYEVYTNQRTAGALEGIPQDIKAKARKIADKTEESRATQLAVQLKSFKKEFPKYDVKFNPDLRRFEGIEKIDTSQMSRVDKLQLDDFNKLSSKVTTPKGDIFSLVSASSSGGGVSQITGAVVQDKPSVVERAKGLFFGDKQIQPSSKINLTTKGGTFVSAYGIGAGGTAIITPLTPAQQETFAKAEAKSTAILTSPMKFLGGEYEWQKKLFPEKEGTSPSDVVKYEQATSYTDLWKSGDLPAVVRKASYDIGTKYFQTTEKVRVKTIGGKSLTAEEQKSIGTGFGVFFLAEGFAPAFQTGVAARQQVVQKEGTYIYDYVKGKWVKKKKGDMTRFEALGEFSRVSPERQINILEDSFKGRVYLDKKSLLKDLDKAKKFMKESGMTDVQIQDRLTKLTRRLTNKGVEVPVIESKGMIKPKSVEESIPFGTRVPQMKQAGKVTGGAISQQEMFPMISAKSDTKFSELTQQSPYTTSKFGQEQRFEQLSKTDSKVKGMSLLSLGQLSKLKTKQDTRQKQGTKQFETLKQVPKQVQVSRSALRNMLTTKQSAVKRPRSLVRMKQGTRAIPREKPPPPTPKIIIPIDLGGKGKPSKKMKGIFAAFGKRFGKEVALGGGTKEEAEKRLEKFLVGTLGASGYLRGKKGKVKSTLLGKKGFRKSKLSPLTVVEVKKKRLRKAGTGKEIQAFRKTPSKKKLLLGL